MNDLQIANSVIQAMAKGHAFDQGVRQAENQKIAEEMSRLSSLVTGLEAQCASLQKEALAKDEKIAALEMHASAGYTLVTAAPAAS